jgi:hypothetical protein
MAIYKVKVLFVSAVAGCDGTHSSWHGFFFDNFSLDPSTDLEILDINESINLLAELP